MTNAELIQTIRAEIERRIDIIKPDVGQGFILREQITRQLQDLLSFLSTLESEKPMNQDGLEKEIGAYFKDWYVHESDQGYSLQTPTGSAVMGHMEKVARHFYELGCRRTAEKYDEIEYNRQRAEEEGSEELSDEISHISKRYPEVSFAKLSRIAVYFAKWGAEHLKK